MADLKERLAKLDEVSKADEAFGERFAAAMTAHDKDAIIALAAEKDVVLTDEDFVMPDLDAMDLDDAELEAVAGGKDWEKVARGIDKDCHYGSAVACGAFFGVALWGVKFED